MAEETSSAAAEPSSASNPTTNGTTTNGTSKGGTSQGISQRGHGFGTAPVFLASISTILGAILFLRFGYAVAHVGVVGALLVILLGHMVTIPTALAVSEIATNRTVEGGGAYFIISRSFGTTIGADIGIWLYLSQAVSIAFYMIAFAESFQPLAPQIESLTGYVFDPRIISVPSTLLLVVLMLTRGAEVGVKALWVVVFVLAVTLGLFFAGSPVKEMGTRSVDLFATVDNADSFFVVFAICFPAFTGMIAGVGLSGDLANPRRSIPLGTMAATLVGLLIYAAVAIKLYVSAPPESLAKDQLIMSRIALWGPAIPIGLGCAALSSAIGSFLVAPRTLQALAGDRSFPWQPINEFLVKGVGKANEPRNATTVTAVVAVLMVALGSIDFVARIISMFFMVTYGAICAISFLEHFSARPSYRPSFRSKWYISLFGALICLLMMFQMDPLYAVLSLVSMVALYKVVQRGHGAGARDDMSAILREGMNQATRYMQLTLQKSLAVRRRGGADWRPSVIMVDGKTFERTAPLRLLRWICHRYGFGTYLHFIEGHLNRETYRQKRKLLGRLIESAQHGKGGIYVDTMISPSFRSALAQSLQVPGVSGMENNTVVFEFSTHDKTEDIQEVYESCLFSGVTELNTLVLRHGDHHFGDRRNIHIWLTWHDYDNANLMILLAYILLGHPDWRGAEISVYAAFPRQEVEQRKEEIKGMITSGRLPISERRVRIIPTDARGNVSEMVQKTSSHADLVILGFTGERLETKGVELLTRYPELRDVLFVWAQERILIE